MGGAEETAALGKAAHDGGTSSAELYFFSLRHSVPQLTMQRLDSRIAIRRYLKRSQCDGARGRQRVCVLTSTNRVEVRIVGDGLPGKEAVSALALRQELGPVSPTFLQIPPHSQIPSQDARARPEEWLPPAHEHRARRRNDRPAHHGCEPCRSNFPSASQNVRSWPSTRSALSTRKPRLLSSRNPSLRTESASRDPLCGKPLIFAAAQAVLAFEGTIESPGEAVGMAVYFFNVRELANLRCPAQEAVSSPPGQARLASTWRTSSSPSRSAGRASGRHCSPGWARLRR
jgi:hypothetical protein